MGSILCVVAARGGSKRLPRKNLLPLGGKPMVQWSLEAALGARSIDELCLSSDSEEILDVGRGLKGVTAIRRPPELATDSAGSIDVVLHAAECMEELRGRAFEILVLVQPTSPFVSAGDIDGVLERLVKGKHASVISVCPAEHPPLWTNTLPEDLCMKAFLDERYRGLRSQDLPPFYRLNGAVYASYASGLRKSRSYLQGEGSYAYIMPQERSVDIDTELDFRYAQFLLDQGKDE